MHFIIFFILFVNTQCSENYFTRRMKIIELESKLNLGGNIILSDRESRINNCLMQYKFEEIGYGYDHPEAYNFSKHYFYYKDNIRKSKVYKIIKKMPKGAVLHVHDMAILGPDYLLNITYKDHLYVCFMNPVKFLFSNHIPNASCDTIWKLMRDIRLAAKNVTQLDLQIRKLFSLVVEKQSLMRLGHMYPSIEDHHWRTISNYFNIVRSLLTYRPVWEQYFYDALKTFIEENVMYVEVRSSLPKLYELNGTVYNQKITAKTYKKIINKFIKDHPDFIGAKIIYAPLREVNTQTLMQYIKVARDISKHVPEIFAGFDLVGREDNGTPLVDFAYILENITDLNFFFHAGETDWYGMVCDENLIDAVLLGAKRIGHAYALTKHPVILKLVVENNIGLEVNVLSNAVMSLVRDVRNHPLSEFLSLGLPVVLSSDYPGAWEADILSDDFYVTFMGVASMFSDLRMLKNLALNSLKFSALDSDKKQKAIEVYHSMWNSFLDKFNCSAY